MLEKVQMMRRNIITFAAFKNYNSISDMVTELTDENGKLRSFSQFQEATNKIYSEYGQRYLQVEYDTVVRSAEMAEQWSDYERDKDLYPSLQYMTQLDGDVRPAHQSLHGVIRSIDDPFWDQYYPPNGWNCRCYVLQSDEPAETGAYEVTEKDVPTIFRTNTGKNGVIFTESHPYFETLNKPNVNFIREMKNILADEDIYDIMYQDNNKLIKMHITHNEIEKAGNMAFAKKLKANTISLLSTSSIGKHVDIIADGRIIEVKELTTSSYQTLRKRVLQAIEQFNGSKYRKSHETMDIGIVLKGNAYFKNKLVKYIHENHAIIQTLYLVIDDGDIEIVYKRK